MGKRFLILLALLFSLTGMTTVDQQALRFPMLLTNAGFENGAAGWTNAGSGTLTITTTAADVGWGTRAASWDAAANNDTLTSTQTTLAPGLYGGACRLEFLQKGGDSALTAYVIDGSLATVTSVALSTQATYAKISVNFTCPTSGTLAVQFKSTGNAAAVKIDSVYVGFAVPIASTDIIDGAIVNADVNASAAIARTKLASGTASHVLINDGSGVMSSEAQLALSRGGSNKNLTAVAGGVLYTDSDSHEVTAAGTSGQYLKSNASSAPTWSAIDLSTSSVTGTLPLGGGGTGQTTAANAFKSLAGYTAKGDFVGYDGSARGILAVGTDGQVLTADAASTYGVKWGDGGAGVGEINAVLNPSAASATTGWSAGTSHSVARDTSHSPLSPVVSTSIACTATSNGSETSTSGCYYTISTFPTGLQNRKLKVEFWVTAPAGDDWILSVYSGSTRMPLSTDVSAITDINGAAALTGKYTAYFDADGSSSYTVHFTRSIGSGTTILYATGVIVGPGIQPQGAIVGEWQTYTPTFTSMSGTGVGKWRRVGDTMEVYAYIQSTSTVSAEIKVSIPSGYTIDTGKLAVASFEQTVGTAAVNKSGGNLYVGTVGYRASSTDLAFYENNSAGLWNATRPITWASGDRLSTHFVVPISNFGGNGTINVAQNDVEYAYNSSGTTAAGGSDTTSFAYGPAGATVGAIASTTASSSTTMRVRFPTPIQDGDEIRFQIYDTNGAWVDQAAFGIPWQLANTARYGVLLTKVSGNTTDVDVAFGNNGARNAAGSFGGNGQTWNSAAGSSKWRLAHYKGGAAVGFGHASSTSSGLVNTTTQSFGGAKTIVGNADDIQLKVTANATQTSHVFEVETSGGTNLFDVENDATILIKTSNGVGFFVLNQGTGTSACNTLCATEPSSLNSSSGTCINAWNATSSAPLSTSTVTACADTTNIARRCLCAGIN